MGNLIDTGLAIVIAFTAIFTIAGVACIFLLAREAASSTLVGVALGAIVVAAVLKLTKFI